MFSSLCLNSHRVCALQDQDGGQQSRLAEQSNTPGVTCRCVEDANCTSYQGETKPHEAPKESALAEQEQKKKGKKPAKPSSAKAAPWAAQKGDSPQCNCKEETCI
ncbi:hypothetical protein ABBQ38_000813 [Trebouxia sp. C0009 RCD-2024]